MRAKAVAISAAVYFIAASVCAYLGVTIATSNIDWKSTIDTLLYNLQTNYSYVYDYWYQAGETWYDGYKTILTFSGEMWGDIVNCVYETFGGSSSGSGSDSVSFEVNVNESGIYGFTSDSANQLSFHADTISENTSITVSLNNFNVSVYCHVANNTLLSTMSEGYFSGISIHFSSNDLTLFSGSWGAGFWGNQPSATYSCKYYNGYVISVDYDGNYASSSYGFNSNFFGSCKGHTVQFCSDSNGAYLYDLNTSQAVELVCGDTKMTYFSSTNQLLEFLFQSVGLAHENFTGLFDTVVTGSDVISDIGSDVVINSDYFPTADDLTKTYDDVQVVIGTDIADITVDSVRDLTAEDIYPSDIPAISSPNSLWVTKFPFCLPWDLYNLVACFWSGELAEAPTFTIPIVWESWEINEEIIIDFSVLDPIMPLFRLFISLAWILFLILFTRKLIGAE